LEEEGEKKTLTSTMLRVTAGVLLVLDDGRSGRLHTAPTVQLRRRKRRRNRS
jgi:hypothetical protein